MIAGGSLNTLDFVFLPVIIRKSPSEYKNAERTRVTREVTEESIKIPAQNFKYAKFRKKYNEVINNYAVPYVHDGLWVIVPGKEWELYKQLKRLIEEAKKDGISEGEIKFYASVIGSPKGFVIAEIKRQMEEVRSEIGEIEKELKSLGSEKNQLTSKKKQLEKKQQRVRLLEELYKVIMNNYLPSNETLKVLDAINSLTSKEGK